MMSGKMYAEFVKPYNARAYQATRGGLLHFCGQGDQFYDQMLTTPGVTGINFGNPEMQDIEARYAAAKTHKVCLLWDGELPPSMADVTTGMVHKRIVRSWGEAEKLKIED